jgi:hypothetical protein
VRRSNKKAVPAAVIILSLMGGLTPAHAATKGARSSCSELKQLTVTKPVTPQLAKLAHSQRGRSYLRLRARVVCTFNKRKPGAHIVFLGVGRHHRVPSPQRVNHSIQLFQRWLAPPPVVATGGGGASGASASPSTPTGSAPPSGGGCGDLPAYIVQRESGGNPNARNGRYGGCAQVDDAHFAPGGACAGLGYITCVNKLWDGGRGASNWPTAANPPR